jgi:hypothetical protein
MIKTRNRITTMNNPLFGTLAIAANRDEMMPRKPLPAPLPPKKPLPEILRKQ